MDAAKTISNLSKASESAGSGCSRQLVGAVKGCMTSWWNKPHGVSQLYISCECCSYASFTVPDTAGGFS